MEENEPIKFLRKKDFKFMKKLGYGSFGETILILDEYINQQFVCKKYKPLEFIDKKEFYTNFINEIKLLHLLHNDNIVRVFNYYLYPDLFTGYIMMEYVEGLTIDEYLESNPENINNIFEQTIKGFAYLERNNILHRDIRPSNILVSKDHNVKIIDFGFGKQINFNEDNQKSISINWWGSEIPEEFKHKIYNSNTEIFFIGKMFQSILENIETSFKFENILSKMCQVDISKRSSSFKSILKDINEDISTVDLFSNEDKVIYKNFADQLFNSLSKREFKSTLHLDSDKIIRKLEFLQKKTMLEDFINPRHILKIFIEGDYSHYSSSQYYLSTNILDEFISFFKDMSQEKQNIILYNLETRFEDIETYFSIDDDQIPF